MKHSFIKNTFPRLKSVTWNDVGMNAVGGVGGAVVNSLLSIMQVGKERPAASYFSRRFKIDFLS